MKNESIKNGFRAICSAINAGAMLRDERKEQMHKDAGVILASEAQRRKNRRAIIRAKSDIAKHDIIKASGVISDCCGSACLRNYAGEIICADCLTACSCIEVTR